MRGAWWWVVAAGILAAGCTSLQSDYAKTDLTSRRTFQPTDMKRFNRTFIDKGEVTPEPVVKALYLQWEPADFDGNRRWDGFDVKLTPVDASGRVLHKRAFTRFQLHRFDPDHKNRLGKLLLTWVEQPGDLDPTWEKDGYHFRLAWWQNKPRDVNYVVLVVTFNEEGTDEKQGLTKTCAPVSVVQPRYETP